MTSLPNDLDDLMSRIEEINHKGALDLTGPDIDDIIAYHRAQRAKKARGEKPAQFKSDTKAVDEIVAKLIPKPATDGKPWRRL